MKKVLASILMATSIGAMASPAQCLLNWAQSEGANIHQEKSHLNAAKWGDKATFKWDKQGPTDGYGVFYKNSKDAYNSITYDGPWHCHCTYNAQYVYPDGYLGAVGICGVW